MNSNVNQKELISRAKDGDVEAFEALIAPIEGRLYNLALHLTGNSHDAADLAQEALIKVYKYLPKYRGEAEFFTWVYAITNNLYRDHLRKVKRRAEESLDKTFEVGDGEVGRQVVDEKQNVEAHISHSESESELRRLIAQIPLPYRQVLVYREYMHYSYQEIAGLLAIELGTVKSRFSRAKKMLKEKILENPEIYEKVLANREQNSVNISQNTMKNTMKNKKNSGKDGE